jgi:hypothetical protein
MDWIPALLKHLALSRSAIAAAFVTALVLYAGPRLFPTYVEPVPREWAAVVVGVLVFSGFLLCTWAVSGLWRWCARRWEQTCALLASQRISDMEADFLRGLGQRPSEPWSLERLPYDELQLSRLEVLELVHGLARKGLVSINPYKTELVSLTATGRQRALEIQRRQGGGAT